MKNKTLKYSIILFVVILSLLAFPFSKAIEVNRQNSSISEVASDDITIDGTLELVDVTTDSVTLDYTYVSGSIPTGIYQTVLITDQIEIANIGSFGESGRQTYVGLDSATTYTNVTLAFIDFSGTRYVLEPTDGRLNFTTQNSDLTIDYLNAIVESDSTTGIFNFNLDYNGSTVTNAAIVDETIGLNQSITTVDGQNTHKINFYKENLIVNAKLVIDYDLDGTAKQVTDDFNTITTGNIQFLNPIAYIENITNTSVNLHWSFSTSEEIIINQLSVTGKANDTDFTTPYVLASTANYGSEVITPLTPNTSYTDLNLEINYNDGQIYEITIDDFSTAQDAPTLVSATWTETSSVSSTFNWDIQSNGNAIIGLTLEMNEENIELDSIWTGSQVISSLDSNTNYYCSLEVEYLDVNSNSKTIIFETIPTLTTVSGQPEKIVAEFDNVGPTYVRFNWNLNSHGSSINKLTLQYYLGDDTATQLTYVLDSNYDSGQQQITGLTSDTTFSNITLKVDYTNSLDEILSTEIEVVDTLTTLSAGPTVNSFNLVLGNQWGYLSYDISPGIHTIEAINLVGTSYDLVGEPVPVDYSVYIGTETSKTDYLITNFQVSTLYSNLRLEITYDGGKVTYSNLEDGNQHNFVTNNYIRDSFFEIIGTNLFGQITIDEGIRTITSIRVQITEGVTFDQTYGPTDEINFIVPITGTMPTSISIRYEVSFTEGDNFVFQETIQLS